MKDSNSHSRGNFLSRLGLVFISALLVTGCVSATLGAAIITSVDIATDRRTIGTYVDDNAVEIKIRRAIGKDSEIGPNVNISVTSMNGIVLLTGQASRQEQTRRAAAISRGYTEAREVINQVVLADKTTFSSRSKDSWITTKVKTALVRSRDVKASKVKVVTENATVFLLGMVTKSEADEAVDAARSVKGVLGVTKVFEYL
jgi:osmotically-inducible protein OsmY